MINVRKQDWTDNCYTDYGYHIMLQGAVPPEILPQIGEAIQDGYPSIKIFTTDITPSRRGRKITHGHIWEIFKVLKKEGGIGAIHAEDDEIVMHMYDVLQREGRTGFENLAEVHNTMSEDLSFRRIIRLAEHVDGTPLYMMHVSAATGVAAIEAAFPGTTSDMGVDRAKLSAAVLGDDDAMRRLEGIVHPAVDSAC